MNHCLCTKWHPCTLEQRHAWCPRMDDLFTMTNKLCVTCKHTRHRSYVTMVLWVIHATHFTGGTQTATSIFGPQRLWSGDYSCVRVGFTTARKTLHCLSCKWSCSVWQKDVTTRITSPPLVPWIKEDVVGKLLPTLSGHVVCKHLIKWCYCLCHLSREQDGGKTRQYEHALGCIKRTTV